MISLKLKLLHRLNRYLHFVDGGRNLISITSPVIVFGTRNSIALLENPSILNSINKTNFVKYPRALIFRDVMVSTASGNVFKRYGKNVYYVVESDYRHPYQSLWSSSRPMRQLGKKIDALSMVVGRRSGNYYHFLIEELPDILLELKLKPELVLVNEGSPNFVFEYLSKFTDWQLVKNEFLSVKRLIKVPKFPQQLYDVKFNRFELLRESLDLNRFRNQSTRTRIIIQRNPNDELERLVCLEFQKFGYLIITSQGLLVDEQISLFSNAEHVVGFHGAGLANIVFCRKGASVTELTFGTDENYHLRRSLGGRCYEPLARQLKLHYKYLELDSGQPLRQQIKREVLY